LSPNEKWAIFPQGKDHFLLKNLATHMERLVAYSLREPISEDWPSETCFSPDDKLFALASNLGYVKMWEVDSWREKATFRGFLQAPHSLAFSPDGHRLAVGGDAREAVKLFDTETYEELLNLTATGSQFGSIAFSDDGNVLGARNQKGDVNLWRAPSWEEITAAENPRQSTSDPTDIDQTVHESDVESQ
jgi:WD40 repeat protein